MLKLLHINVNTVTKAEIVAGAGQLSEKSIVSE